MNEPVPSLRLRQLLFTLIVVLTFEGLVRKAVPALSTPLFLLKDMIIAVMAVYIFQMPPAPALVFLANAYRVLMVLMVPLIIITGWHDALLAVFGAKEYLLYPLVAFATFHAFANTRREVAYTFFRRAALLIIPTGALALVQLRLPHDHWLNMSVTGESLEAFSAAGQLRISSTFSFVAQFCDFLNAQVFLIAMGLIHWRKQINAKKLLTLLLLTFLVVSCFATGSRGAVTGNTAIILVAGMLTLMRFQVRNLISISIIIAALYLTALAVNHFSPDTTAAFSKRDGQMVGFSDETRERIFNNYFYVSSDRSLGTFFGNGLGIMSNGSESFSSYASDWRNSIWTETDFSSTLFEGGIYLAIVWYGFRFYVIYVTTRRFIREISQDYLVPLSFLQGFVIIMGAMASLAIQPPTAIWWWLGVGASVLFCWKSVGPDDPEILPPSAAPLNRKFRGRSLYSEVIQSRR